MASKRRQKNPKPKGGKSVSFNPGVVIADTSVPVKISIIDYTADSFIQQDNLAVGNCFAFKDKESVSWINIDGLDKQTVEKIAAAFDIHYLSVEDILRVGQRAKMDVINGRMCCVLNMISYNEETANIDQEQISIVLGKNFVLSFQQEAQKDVFGSLRERLKHPNTKVRQTGADYLCYSLLDVIVDHYFFVLEKISLKIEQLEDEILDSAKARQLAEINLMRKEMIAVKRLIAPVRELVGGIIRDENDLIRESTVKYFRDVHDHITQATELAENQREMLLNLQDLYLSQVNIKMNEVMKVLAIVTTLLAPLTVIVGIYGMNFKYMPELNHPYGYYTCLGLMGIIFLIMLLIFRKRGWF